MAFVKDYEIDIFISYAHCDDVQLPGEDRNWVKGFSSDLEDQLQVIVPGSNLVVVWRDDSLALNRSLEPELDDKLKNSALLLIILSPNYMHSDWCQRELTTFCKNLQRLSDEELMSRIFVVQTLDLDQKPSILSNVSYTFWDSKEKDGCRLHLGSDQRIKKLYVAVLQRLTNQLKSKLTELNNGGRNEVLIVSDTQNRNAISHYQKAVANRYEHWRLLKFQFSIGNHYFPLKAKLLGNNASRDEEYNIVETLSSCKFPKICLLGPSGAGKTTVVRRLLWEANLSNTFAIMVRLRKYNDPVTSCNFIGNWLKESVDEFSLHEAVNKELYLRIKSREGMFIFDGFDELKSDPGWAAKVAEKIQGYFAGYTCCNVIITSRLKDDLQGSFQGFTLFRLEPIERNKVDAFASTVIPTKTARKLKIGNITENLYLTPVMLFFAIWFVSKSKNKGQIKIDSLYQLYDETIKKVLFEPWNERKITGDEVVKIRMDVLKSIVRSWQVSRKPCRITQEDIHKFVSKFDSLKKPTPEELNRIVPTGIFLDKSEDSGFLEYCFVHNSIQEFLYAKILLEDIRRKRTDLFGREYYSREILMLLGSALKESDILQLLKWVQDIEMPLMVRKVATSVLGFVGSEKEFVINNLKNIYYKEEDIGVAGRIALAMHMIGFSETLEHYVNNLGTFLQRLKEDKPERLLTYEIENSIDGIEKWDNNLYHLMDHVVSGVRKQALILLMRSPSPICLVKVYRLCLCEIRSLHDKGEQRKLEKHSSENIRSLRYGIEAIKRNGSRIDKSFIEYLKNELLNLNINVDQKIYEHFNEVAHFLASKEWPLPYITRKENNIPKNSIFLIRHGESDGNIDGRLLGLTYPGKLTNKGIKQAKLTAEELKKAFLHKVTLISSSMGRALETINILATSMDQKPVVIEDNRVAELDFGQWAGVQVSELQSNQKNHFNSWKKNPYKIVPPRGESFFEVKSRVCEALNDHLKFALKEKMDIVIFSHYFPIALIYLELTGNELEKPGNCAITRINYTQKGWIVDPKYHNYSEHLGNLCKNNEEWLTVDGKEMQKHD